MKRVCVYYIYKLIPNTLNQIIVTIVAERHKMSDVKRRLIGVSLSNCVKDIINGQVHIDEVVKIVCGTAFKDNREMNEVIRHYCKGPWNGVPRVLCRMIVNTLLYSGRITQPRLSHKIFNCGTDRFWYTEEAFDNMLDYYADDNNSNRVRKDDLETMKAWKDVIQERLSAYKKLHTYGLDDDDPMRNCFKKNDNIGVPTRWCFDSDWGDDMIDNYKTNNNSED